MQKMYRYPKSGKLAGVCEGIGTYSKIDPVIIRIIFIMWIFLGLGLGCLVYLICWIVIPKFQLE